MVEFLSDRKTKTIDFQLSDNEMNAVADAVHGKARQIFKESSDKKLGLVILVRYDSYGDESVFGLSNIPSDNDLGASRLAENAYIQPREHAILDHLLKAKALEGHEAGEREGTCTLCKAGKQVLIPPYCKSWPWLMLAWRCPFPKAGNKNLLVESVGLCPECYKALAVGAAALNKTTRPLHGWLTREVFAPTADREAKDKVGRNPNNVPTIYGTAYLTPLLDIGMEDEYEAEEFARNVADMLRNGGATKGEFERQMDLVTGFHLVLPENSISEDYRLTFLYYSGQPSRGDIHIRAVVEDVLPPTLIKLHDLVKESTPFIKKTLSMLRGLSMDVILQLHRSVPYLLANSYGPPYFWDQLQMVFHRQPLDVTRAVRNSAHRLQSLSRRLSDPQTIFKIADEILFFLVFIDFVFRYNQEIVNITKENRRIMKPWQELLNELSEENSLKLHKFDTVADLGFAVGAVMSDFCFRYSNAKGKDKNFLTHRVMTFGSSLGWKEIWKRGLAQMQELELKLNPSQKIGKGYLFIPEDLRTKIGILLCELENRQSEIHRKNEEFMCGFWAGYALKRAQGIEEARKRKESSFFTVAQS